MAGESWEAGGQFKKFGAVTCFKKKKKVRLNCRAKNNKKLDLKVKKCFAGVISFLL